MVVAHSVINRNAWWRYLVVVGLALLASLYAAPNLFGEDFAVQISAQRGVVMNARQMQKFLSLLEKENIAYESAALRDEKIVIRFRSAGDQLAAQGVFAKKAPRGYTVALNLATATPDWLLSLRAAPMYLGLDLRGGVYFLMEVDVDAAVEKTINQRVGEIRSVLRSENTRYAAVERRGEILVVKLRNPADSNKARSALEEQFPDMALVAEGDEAVRIDLRFREDALAEVRRFAVRQNITTLRNRVNELGVAEPVIQQQGASRIVVQLPGVQDTARAKDILGATATLEYRMADDAKDPRRAAARGFAPPGTVLYYFRDGTPILLKKRVIVTGENIINAQSGIDQRRGSPMVSVTLDAIGGKRMLANTKRNVGKRMAVVFIESQSVNKTVDGVVKRERVVNKSVINAAVIEEQFSNRFQTTGLDSPTEARDLALLLRAGALAAPMDIVEERTIGPSLGADNIEQGFLSVVIGLVLVLIFMVARYRVFGLIADLALCLNLVFIIAVLSVLQATLTLPGIAGIVLTVGMAVDANVLIFERIREELRSGQKIQMAIEAGYNRAFLTIADANITTLIAAVVLFGFGTGPIKGFAVTLSIGIVTSMFTAIVLSRVIVNRLYGYGRSPTRLLI